MVRVRWVTCGGPDGCGEQFTHKVLLTKHLDRKLCPGPPNPPPPPPPTGPPEEVNGKDHLEYSTGSMYLCNAHCTCNALIWSPQSDVVASREPGEAAAPCTVMVGLCIVVPRNVLQCCHRVTHDFSPHCTTVLHCAPLRSTALLCTGLH
jgi:hypothetical protein